MTLDGALSSAASGLDSITKRLALISQNVANAGTPDYVRQAVAVNSASAGDQAFGVRTGVATRAMDEHLQGDLLTAVASEAGEQVTQSALARIDEVSGSPGSGQDLPGLLGALRDAFSQLGANPANGTQQRQVVNRASGLVDGLHALAGSLLDARQSAQDSLVLDVATVNTALRGLGALSDQVIQAKSRGESTADLEDQRDTQMRALAGLTGARFLHQANGDLLAVSGGMVLPLRAATGPFSVGEATLARDTPAAAVPSLLLDGAPASGLGGQLGAHLALRDSTLPGLQAGLDDYTQTLAAGFDAQGLTLFTDPAGVVPPPGSAGFSQTIRVAAAVEATPSLVRDGAGPASTAGNAGLIDRVLDTVFAGGAATLTGRATSLVAGHASMAAASAARAETDGAVRSSLQAKLSAATGVSVDGELAAMVQLQNAYGANAKVVAAVQTMWNQLLETVR